MMKKLLTVVAALWLMNTLFGQESIGPITRMDFGTENSKMQLRANNPIDSTFDYITDTLLLPFFDEFSLSHFQEYDAQYTDPNVTEELFHKLLANPSGTLLPATTVLTTQVTYRRVVDVTNGTSNDINYIPISLKNGDFSTFPVNYTITNGYPPYIVIDTIDFPNDPDTIWISDPELRQDSARIFHVLITDPNALWLDHHAYHNYTFAVDPWSLGVATFDGLDEQGFPYNFGSTSSGVADFLTSKPLNLSSFLPADSIYISFLVQPEGFGDVPEQVDSLVLEFYDVVADQWNYIWGIKGSSNTDFQIGHIPVKQAIYLKKGFQFRFKNVGGLSGSLDHFHLDYVHLRKASGYQDSIYTDFAWSYPVGSLIKDYTSVPWDHWKNNFAGKMNNQARVVVHNTNFVAKNPNLSQVRVKYAGGLQGTFPMSNASMTTVVTENYQAFETATTYHDFSAGYHFDETVPGDEAEFDIVGIATIQEPTFNQNDTCYAKQFFGDYYAYDDSSAEKAYGVTGAQSRLAYKFTPYEADSIIGVRMCFVPSVNDVSDKLFLLTIWDDNNGVPGTVLYQDGFAESRTPVYEPGINQFTTYYLKDTMKLRVEGTFYVGWRQVDADRLNIGLDMNTPNGDKIFFSINGGASWSTSSYAGSMLMRPVFSTESNADLAVGELEQELPWELYPNPTSGSISVEWKNEQPFPGAICRDAQGRIIRVIEPREQQLQFDLTDVPAGIYFVELNGANRQVKKAVRY